MIFLILTLLGGMVLGQRFRVLILVPGSAILLPLAIGVGLVRYDGLGPTLLSTIFALASLQIGYFVGLGIRYMMAASRVHDRRVAGARSADPIERSAI
jgi:hypothetical protein